MTPARAIQQDETATILIVDDNPDNRLLLASQLGMHGYKIIEASGGHQGIEQAQANQPDLILLDVMMPIMNGFEVCTHLKADPGTAHIPIIMVTALRDIEYRIRGIEVGADEFLSRPHHREELLVRVRSLIRLKHARDKLEEERNRLRLLYNVTRAATNSQLDLYQMMIEIISHTQSAVAATKGSIMLIDALGEVTHKIVVRPGLTPEITEDVTRAVLHQGLAGWLIRNNRGDVIEDATQDSRWIILPDDTEQVGSAIGVPFIDSGTVLGVMILVHHEPGFFRPEHMALIETIAAQVTVAIRNAYLFNQISEHRQKLSAILAQSSDAIITTDENFAVEMVNQAAEILFNISEIEVVSRPLNGIETFQRLVPLFKQAAQQPVTQELPASGGKTLFASITPIQDVGYMAVLQDITQMKENERMRLEQERLARQQLKDTFSRYMSPRLVEQVLSDEPGLLARRQRRAAVVLFADLRGFTRMITGLDPSQAIAILNQFFTEMTEVVYRHDGTIFDLVGDELMVGFNVPIEQKDAEVRAVQAAVAMQTRFDELRQIWFQDTGAELGLGIGIDSGDVIMGNVGAETRMNFAMVGEAVNTAHRLVDIAQDGQIVITAAIFRLLQRLDGNFHFLENGAHFESLGEIVLKGKPAPQAVYQAMITRTPLEPVMGR